MNDKYPAHAAQTGGDRQEDPELGSALSERLADALAPVALPEPASRRMRSRLLARVRAAAAGSVSTTIRVADDRWKPLLPKVSILMLRRDRDTVSYLLRLEPGAMLPAHSHPIEEECVVLHGEVKIGDLTIGVGDYHLAHVDSHHQVLSSTNGATIFLRGAASTIEAH